jgi:hypothetical protein
VLAAAIEASVDFIVTENTSHFPDEACAAYGIRAIGADDFFLELFHLSPDEMIRALREQAEAWASIWDLADGLDKMESRAPQFVHAVREALGRSGDEA